MKKIIKKQEADALFVELIEGTVDLDEQEFRELFNRIDQRFGITVETDNEEPEFYCESGESWTEVLQHNQLLIGAHVVSEWDIFFMGSRGGGGSGWWIERDNVSVDSDLEELLSLAEIVPETPEVPSPEDSSGTE